MRIDLNADLGEGTGMDAAIMPWITSANICCGAHAGGEMDMRTAIALSLKYGVNVGAHPGYADRENFGRVEVEQPDLGRALLQNQLKALESLAREYGTSVRYVKPHGAFYHRLGRDRAMAKVFAEVCIACGWPVVGLPNTELQRNVEELGGAFIAEGFADRRYLPDGSLIPRSEPAALIHDTQEAIDQVDWLLRKQGVRTICVHGDTPGAVEFAKAIRQAMESSGHEVRAFA